LFIHELGVLHLLSGEYEEAVGFFLQVATNCTEYDAMTREPSIFNLGHAYRKLRDFDNAIHWYRAALEISPRVASTYSALGFTQHLRGDLNAAIELYHQSLSLKSDDTFTCEMLTEALKDALEQAEDPTVLPGHTSDFSQPLMGGQFASTHGSSSLSVAESMDVSAPTRW